MKRKQLLKPEFVRLPVADLAVVCKNSRYCPILEPERCPFNFGSACDKVNWQDWYDILHKNDE